MRRSTVAVCAGGLIVLAGAALTAEPWIEALRWQASPEAAQAERNAAAPLTIRTQPTSSGLPGPATRLSDRGETSSRSAAAPSDPSTLGGDLSSSQTAPSQTAPSDPNSGSSAAPSQPVPSGPNSRSDTAPSDPSASGPNSRSGAAPQQPAPGAPISPSGIAPSQPATPPTLGPSPLRLSQAAFQFVDPPAPGANVRLTLAVQNATDAPSSTLSLDLPLKWLDGYAIRGVQPLPADNLVDGQKLSTARRLTFNGPAPNEVLDIEIDLATTAEVVDSPDLLVSDSEGREVGRAHPPTEAPPAEPGPVYAIDIPHLRLHAGVVQVDWEPPLFVIGQLRGSAHVTEGNSVLVGHLRGAAGYNVFDHLDQVHPGDPIVATSRGQTYDFIVTDTRVLPGDDVSPAEPTSAPRLTLMTCAGDWNPITRDYSARLWVIAQPADQALAPAAQPSPTPKPTTSSDQIAPHGGLGNSDTDLAAAYGAPTGEAAPGLAVYAAHNGAAHRASFTDTIDGARRSILITEHLPTRDTRTLQAATQRARALVPRDFLPRSNGPEGNARFAVERFSSAALARLVPADTFLSADGAPGDILVVYARDSAGQVSDIIVGLGNDPAPLMAAIDLR